MEALAIQIQETEYQPRLPVSLELEQSQVHLASEVGYDQLTKLRFARWLGSVASEVSVGAENSVERSENTDLLSNLHEVRAGSAEARAMVDANVAAAVGEVCFKEDHITKVSTTVNENGQRVQFGQKLRDTHKNAFTMRPDRHPILQAITEAEGLNEFRIEDGLRAGKLDDCYYVVASVVPAGVPEDQLGHKGDGYFLDSLTFVAQATTRGASGEVTTESGFMAGVDAAEEDNFEQRLMKRHDIIALSKIYQVFNKEVPITAAGFIENGLFIPKHMMPNGVVDFMRWCDEAAGRSRQPEFYARLVEESKKREASLDDVKRRVREELLARADEFSEPMQAVKELWRLAKKHIVEASFHNEYIDPKVLGREAAGYVRQIRSLVASGNIHQAAELYTKAYETALITGCGGGAGGRSGMSATGERSSGGNSWDGGENHKGVCVNCHKFTDVGVENWCKDCISGHCGTK